MLKSLIVLQNDPQSQIASVAQWLQEAGASFRIVKAYDSERPVRPADGIIALGGRPSATEDETYPFLSWEKEFLGEEAAKGTPIFGICLGMQLLNLALGGTMDIRGPRGVESGIIPLEWTAEAAGDPLFDPLVRRFPDGIMVSADHGDGILDPPPDTSLLAFSQAAYIHAMRKGYACGVQFHPEADLNRVRLWEKYRSFAPGTIEKPWRANKPQLDEMGRILTSSFLNCDRW